MFIKSIRFVRGGTRNASVRRRSGTRLRYSPPFDEGPLITRYCPASRARSGFGASGRVPAAKAERPLWVQSRDLREDAGQRARSAHLGHSWDRNRAARFDPLLTVIASLTAGRGGYEAT
jgi:hypothetical protein